MWLEAQCQCLPTEIRTRSLTRSSPEGAMEYGKILFWTEATYISVPKTKRHLVSCNLCSLSFDSCQLAALLLANSSQKAMCYPSSKLHVHWLTTLLNFFYSSHSPRLLLLCFGHVGRRINDTSISNQPGDYWDFLLLQFGIWSSCSEKPLENDWLPQCLFSLYCSGSSGLHGSVVKGTYRSLDGHFPGCLLPVHSCGSCLLQSLL